jgi:hypothetical protein
VVKTYPIEGADNVEMCQILDYHVVVKKSENFKAGDEVVYIEVDSLLPDGLSKEDAIKLRALRKLDKKTPSEETTNEINSIVAKSIYPEFEFLRAKYFEIRPMELRKLKVISFGLILNKDIIKKFQDRLPEGDPLKTKVYSIGDDLSDLLKIEKFDEETDTLTESKSKSKVDKFLMKYKWYRRLKKIVTPKFKGDWPAMLPSKSSENNIQKEFTKLKKSLEEKPRRLYVTEKMEGQNFSLFKTRYKFLKFFTKSITGVCSHYRFIRKPDGTGFWERANRMGLLKKMVAVPDDYFVRGEMCGPGVSAGAINIYDFTENRFFVFEVYKLTEKKFLSFVEIQEFCSTYNFECVPVINENFVLPETVQELLDMSNGKSIFGDMLREGFIIRDYDDVTFSVKVRSPEYLVLHAHKPKQN